MDKTPERRALGDAAINEALRLRSDLPEVHLATAAHLYRSYRNYERARAHLAIAERARPNNPKALQLAALRDRRQRGDFEGSTRVLQKAVTLDPRNTEFLYDVAENYWRLRQYQAYIQCCDRLIELEPDKSYFKVMKTWAPLAQMADLAPYHGALESLPPSLINDPEVVSNRIWSAMLARNWTAAREILRASSHERLAFLERMPFLLAPAMVPRDCVEIVIKFFEGGRPTMEGEFAVARDQLSRIVTADPEDAEILSALAMIDAALGRKELAIPEAKRAVELLPVSRDALKGTGLKIYLAAVYAWTNERELALQELALSATTPGGVTYGFLKLAPQWDPIRDDPRFEKLVSDLAPRE